MDQPKEVAIPRVEWSRDRWRHVTLNGQGRDPIIFEVSYLYTGWAVLTATSFSYGESKNFTPHRIKTPDPIEIKFGTVDYVGEGTRHAKSYANSSKGASRQMGEMYAKKFS